MSYRYKSYGTKPRPVTNWDEVPVFIDIPYLARI